MTKRKEGHEIKYKGFVFLGLRGRTKVQLLPSNRRANLWGLATSGTRIHL